MFFLASCAKPNFVLNNGYQPAPEPGQTSHLFTYDVGQKEVIDLAETCPNGVGRVEAHQFDKNIAVWAGTTVVSGEALPWVYNPRAWSM